MKTLHFLSFWLILSLANHEFACSQSSIKNPFKANKKHWTNTINWQNTIPIRDHKELIKANGIVDSTAFHALLKKISDQSGGVLLLDNSTYHFNYNLEIPNGVVLMGDKSSVLEFSKIVWNEKKQNAKSASMLTGQVKKIISAENAQNFGLINLSINRALIDFSSKNIQGVILQNLTIDNAYAYDSRIPNDFQKSSGKNWQRWIDKNVANINVKVISNCVITKCKINTKPTDNYRQDYYMLADGFVIDGGQAKLKVANHTAISVESTYSGGIQIKENSCWVVAGNQAIVINGQPLERGNEITEISDADNITKDGLTLSKKEYYQLYEKDEIAEQKTYIHLEQDTLRYRLIKPENYDKNQSYPIVLFFSDKSEKGNDNRQQLRQFIWQLTTHENRKKFPCFIVVPQIPANEKQWTEGTQNTWLMASSIDIVEQTAKQYPNIDLNRLYAIGTGYGAEATYGLSIYYPEKIAAFVPFSTYYRLQRNTAKVINPIPQWVFFGENDAWLDSPKQQFMKVYRLMEQTPFQFTLIKGLGHHCWNEVNTQVPEFFPWLFAQSKSK